MSTLIILSTLSLLPLLVLSALSPPSLSWPPLLLHRSSRHACFYLCLYVLEWVGRELNQSGVPLCSAICLWWTWMRSLVCKLLSFGWVPFPWFECIFILFTLISPPVIDHVSVPCCAGQVGLFLLSHVHRLWWRSICRHYQTGGGLGLCIYSTQTSVVLRVCPICFQRSELYSFVTNHPFFYYFLMLQCFLCHLMCVCDVCLSPRNQRTPSRFDKRVTWQPWPLPPLPSAMTTDTSLNVSSLSPLSCFFALKLRKVKRIRRIQVKPC